MMLLRGMVDGIFSGENYLMAKKLLDVSALRNEALASNIANAETPGYKRVDVDKSFEVQLNNAAEKSDTNALRQLQPIIVQDTCAAAVRPDGNTVMLEKEMALSGKNQLEYEFLSQYLSSNIQRLQSAIKSNN